MNEIIDALPGLGAVSLATGLIAAHRLIFGDPDANQHDISDYHEPAADRQRLNRDALIRDALLTRRMVKAAIEADILPPAPPGTNAGGSPIHAALIAERVVAEQLRKQYGTTNPDTIAETMLRQLAAEQRGDVDDPAHGHAVCWDGTCELGCPACADEAVTR